MYMYMCVCVWEREGREGRGVVVGGSVGECVLVRMCVLVCVVRADSLRSVPQQLHQAQRMFGGIGNVLLSRPVLKLKMGKIHWFLVVNL